MMLEDLKAVIGYAAVAALALVFAALIWGGDADGATDDERRAAATLERIESHLKQIADGTCLNRTLCGRP